MELKDILSEIDKKFIEVAYKGKSFKNYKFEYEKEVKLLCHLYNNSSIDINFYTINQNIKPYILIKIGKENWDEIINKIYISPLNRSENIVEGIKLFLEKNNIEIELSEIVKSECPSRRT